MYINKFIIYTIVVLVATAYFGLFIPYLISFKSNFVAVAGIVMAVLGAMLSVLFLDREINFWLTKTKEKD